MDGGPGSATKAAGPSWATSPLEPRVLAVFAAIGFVWMHIWFWETTWIPHPGSVGLFFVVNGLLLLANVVAVAWWMRRLRPTYVVAGLAACAVGVAAGFATAWMVHLALGIPEV